MSLIQAQDTSFQLGKSKSKIISLCIFEQSVKDAAKH